MIVSSIISFYAAVRDFMERDRLFDLESKLLLLESSTSFQIGQLIIQALKHPATKLLRLPFDLLRLGLKRSKSERNVAYRSAYSELSRKYNIDAELWFSGLNWEISTNQSPRVFAIVCDERNEILGSVVKVDGLHPNMYRPLLNTIRAKALIIDELALSGSSPWRYAYSGVDSHLDQSLMEIVDWATRNGIPIIFWRSVASPIRFRAELEINCTHVMSTDTDHAGRTLTFWQSVVFAKKTVQEVSMCGRDLLPPGLKTSDCGSQIRYLYTEFSPNKALAEFLSLIGHRNSTRITLVTPNAELAATLESGAQSVSESNFSIDQILYLSSNSSVENQVEDAFVRGISDGAEICTYLGQSTHILYWHESVENFEPNVLNLLIGSVMSCADVVGFSQSGEFESTAHFVSRTMLVRRTGRQGDRSIISLLDDGAETNQLYPSFSFGVPRLNQ